MFYDHSGIKLGIKLNSKSITERSPEKKSPNNWKLSNIVLNNLCINKSKAELYFIYTESK